MAVGTTACGLCCPAPALSWAHARGTHLPWRSGTGHGPSPRGSTAPGRPGPCSLGSLPDKEAGSRGPSTQPTSLRVWGRDRSGQAGGPTWGAGAQVPGVINLPTASCRVCVWPPAAGRSMANCSSAASAGALLLRLLESGNRGVAETPPGQLARCPLRPSLRALETGLLTPQCLGGSCQGRAASSVLKAPVPHLAITTGGQAPSLSTLSACSALLASVPLPGSPALLFLAQAPPPSPEAKTLGRPAGSACAAAGPAQLRPCPHSGASSLRLSSDPLCEHRACEWGFRCTCLPYPHLNSQTVARGPRDWEEGLRAKRGPEIRFPSVLVLVPAAQTKAPLNQPCAPSRRPTCSVRLASLHAHQLSRLGLQLHLLIFSSWSLCLPSWTRWDRMLQGAVGMGRALGMVSAHWAWWGWGLQNVPSSL